MFFGMGKQTMLTRALDSCMHNVRRDNSVPREVKDDIRGEGGGSGGKERQREAGAHHHGIQGRRELTDGYFYFSDHSIIALPRLHRHQTGTVTLLFMRLTRLPGRDKIPRGDIYGAKNSNSEVRYCRFREAKKIYKTPD